MPVREDSPSRSGFAGSTSPASGGGDGRDGRLAENILYFARALRAAGIPVGPGAVLDALAAVHAAGVGDREDFYWTLHAVFVKRHEHTMLFDQAFRIFFRKRGYLDKLIASMLPEHADRRARSRRRRARSASRRRCSAASTSAKTNPRSRSTRGSPCPTARCCRRRISRR